MKSQRQGKLALRRILWVDENNARRGASPWRERAWLVCKPTPNPPRRHAAGLRAEQINVVAPRVSTRGSMQGSTPHMRGAWEDGRYRCWQAISVCKSYHPPTQKIPVRMYNILLAYQIARTPRTWGATLHQAHGENRGGDHARRPITERRRMAVWIHSKGGTSPSVFMGRQ